MVRVDCTYELVKDITTADGRVLFAGSLYCCLDRDDYILKMCEIDNLDSCFILDLDKYESCFIEK